MGALSAKSKNQADKITVSRSMIRAMAGSATKPAIRPVIREVIQPKILIIWSSYELGGAERQLVRLARDWQNHGYKVEFLGMFDGELQSQLIDAGYKTHLLGAMHEPTLLWRVWRKLGLLEIYYEQTLAKKLAIIQPDIVVSAMNFCNVLTGRVWQKIAGIKGHIWNQVDLGLGRMERKLELPAVKNASYLVANSKISAQFLEEEFSEIKNIKEKIYLIPNIIKLETTTDNNLDNESNQERLLPQSQRKVNRYRRQTGEIIVTMVANLSQYKDYQTLLLAWSEVLIRRRKQMAMIKGKKVKSLGNWRLLLAGADGGMQSELLNTAIELGIQKQVEFLGKVSDIGELLAESDLAILASQSEGSSNSLAEYMLSGLPVVASNIEANIELLGRKYEFYYHSELERESLPEVKKWCLSMDACQQQRMSFGQQNNQKISRTNCQTTQKASPVNKQVNKIVLKQQKNFTQKSNEVGFTCGRGGDLAEKIWTLLQDQEQRKILGAHNRRRAQKIFNNSAHLLAYRQLLEKILSPKK